MTVKVCPLKRIESHGIIKFGLCERHACGIFNEYLGECSISALGAIAYAIMDKKGEETDGVQYSKD